MPLGAWELPDVERLVGELLEDLLDTYGVEADVGVGVPRGWTPTSTPHVQVNLDGTPRDDHPVAAYCSVRFVARAATTSACKALASRCQALLLASSTDDLPRFKTLIGPMPSRDPETGHDMAWFTLRVTARLVPVTAPIPTP